MKSATLVVFTALVIGIAYAWPAPDVTGYTSRTVYNGFQQAPVQTYIVEYSSPYYGVPAPLSYSSQGYRSPDTLIRQKRQLMGGLGAGLAGSQAQSQSLGAGMGMGGMGFPYMMGFPFMG